MSNARSIGLSHPEARERQIRLWTTQIVLVALLAMAGTIARGQWLSPQAAAPAAARAFAALNVGRTSAQRVSLRLDAFMPAMKPIANFGIGAVFARPLTAHSDRRAAR